MAEMLDRSRLDPMVERMLMIIRDNRLRGPETPERMLEALNALAACAAIAIYSIGEDDELRFVAKTFFDTAVKQNLVDTAAAIRRKPSRTNGATRRGNGAPASTTH